MATKDGVHLDWKLVTIIGTVVVATFSLFTWFEGRFAEFEKRLDTKYAIKEDVADAELLLFIRLNQNDLENLELIEKALIDIKGPDAQLVKDFADRIRRIRRGNNKVVEEYLQ